MKVLITSGPTREPIDSVRYITNLSSGETGRALANYFQEQNFEVVSLYGKGVPKAEKVKRTSEFVSFEDLDLLLQKTINEERFDAVIHLAAVSDYSVKNVFKGKIESGNDDLHLTLTKNFKILDRIKTYAKENQKKPPFLVGFKLTDDPLKENWFKAVQEIYNRKQVDLVVHNDYSDFDNNDGKHKFRIIDKGQKVTECKSILSLGEQLVKILRSL